MLIPTGATHYSNSYDIIIYYKRDIYQQKTHEYEEKRCWFYWNGNNWIKDISVCSRKFKLVKYLKRERASFIRMNV